MCGHVEFKVGVSDLRDAVRQLTAQQGANRTTEFADILVSEHVAAFRSIGASTQVHVNGIQAGSARLPFHVLEKAAAIARTFEKKETLVLIWDGLIKVGSWQTTDLEIVLGAIPYESLDLPPEATSLDALALAWLLSPTWITERGLDKRVFMAQKAREDAIDRATEAMGRLLVDRQKVAAFVEEHIADAGMMLRKRLRGVLPN